MCLVAIRVTRGAANSMYLADLMLELTRMNNLCESPSSVNIDFHHLRRLLILEIARVVGQSPQPPTLHASVSHAEHDRAASYSKQEMTGNGERSPTKEHRLTNTEEINKLIKSIPGMVEVEQVKKGAVVMQSKIQVPREPREYNYIGRILGPRGISVRRLETETSTSIFIRGRGSLKDPEEERRLRGTAQGQHLNEDLHIIIRAVATDEYDCAEKLRACADKISQLLKPDFDEYKRQQLVQLAIINGTYRP
ncbi:KH domain-containing protein [Aphelenchoides avenae]|nr:KH domain-containing protein [Aphelenchus avenae]